MWILQLDLFIIAVFMVVIPSYCYEQGKCYYVGVVGNWHPRRLPCTTSNHTFPAIIILTSL